MSNEKRKQYFIESAVQGGIVLRVCFYWLAMVFLMAGLAGMVAMAQSANASSDVLLGRLFVSFAPSVIAALVVLPALVFDAIRYSHHSVGPIVRLRNDLERLADGQSVSELRFRKTDNWRDLAEHFNRVAEELQKFRAESPAPEPKTEQVTAK